MATAVALCVLGGCGKDSKPVQVTQAEAVAVNPEAPADVQEKARITTAVAIRDGIEPPPPTMKLRGGEPATPEVLAAYNQELLRYLVRTRDVPETLEQLKRTPGLPRLPTPPPGKQIVYDARNRIIRLEAR